MSHQLRHGGGPKRWASWARANTFEAFSYWVFTLEESMLLPKVSSWHRYKSGARICTDVGKKDTNTPVNVASAHERAFNVQEHQIKKEEVWVAYWSD